MKKFGNIKCKVNDSKQVEPCDPLKRASEIGSPSGTRKGLFAAETVSLSTGKKGRRFWLHKGGDYKKDGVALNYCPFCGESLKESLL